MSVTLPGLAARVGAERVQAYRVPIITTPKRARLFHRPARLPEATVAPVWPRNNLLDSKSVEYMHELGLQ